MSAADWVILVIGFFCACSLGKRDAEKANERAKARRERRKKIDAMIASSDTHQEEKS